MAPQVTYRGAGELGESQSMTHRMYRDLQPFPLDLALQAMSGTTPSALLITMGSGQWDAMLSAAYQAGWILLEIEGERPVRAYRKAPGGWVGVG